LTRYAVEGIAIRKGCSRCGFVWADLSLSAVDGAPGRGLRDGNRGEYVYKEAKPSTLLAAGLRDQLITGAGKVTVTMRPVVAAREGGGAGTWSAGTLNGNIISRSTGAYTSGFRRIGTEGSANFKLEYAPFNPSGSNAPVRIIRTGVNDDAQNDAADFAAFHNLGDNMKCPPVKSRGFTTCGRITTFNTGGADERVLQRT
jgi:hypothetical protein